MQKKKWLVPVLHVVVWMLYFTLPHLMRPNPRGSNININHPPHNALPPQGDIFWFYFTFLGNILLIPVFYLNTYYIFPKLLLARKYVPLVIAELTGLLLHIAIGIGISLFFFPDMPIKPRLFMGSTSYLLVCSVAYGYYSFLESRRIERRQKEREVENMKAELQFLRWQISPHFLFNALNNMVALARKKSERLEPMLIHLSGLMRYMLYETDETRISLDKESEYLQSFVRLQSLRSDNVLLDIQLDVPKDRQLYIEPMLLIPFVENAFKHGIDLIEKPEIHIRLSVAGNLLHFKACNKFIASTGKNKDDARGVGLVNVRKRLNLLYDERHKLEIQMNGYYTVDLKIDLS